MVCAVACAFVTGVPGGLRQASADPPVLVDGGELPLARVAVPYQAQLAVDGRPLGRCRVVIGTLPDGLLLDEDRCVVSGSPTTASESDLTVRVQQPPARTQVVFSVVVLAVEPVAGGRVELPAGAVGAAYRARPPFQGPAPSLCVVSSGSLPPGLSMDAASCRVAGSPTKRGRFRASIETAGPAGLTSVTVQIEVR